MASHSAIHHSVQNRVIQTVAATFCPDLVLCRPGKLSISCLIEAETGDSVTEAGAAQWSTFAVAQPLFGCSCGHARSIALNGFCGRNRIPANIGRWWRNGLLIEFERY